MIAVETKMVDGTSFSARRAPSFLLHLFAGVVACIAFGALVLFAAMPRAGDTSLLVFFAPGTRQSDMIEAVSVAGARIVAFSRLSFAVWVHVEEDQMISRLRDTSLLVTSTMGVSGCMRDPRNVVVGGRP